MVPDLGQGYTFQRYPSGDELTDIGRVREEAEVEVVVGHREEVASRLATRVGEKV